MSADLHNEKKKQKNNFIKNLYPPTVFKQSFSNFHSLILIESEKVQMICALQISKILILKNYFVRLVGL